MQASVCIVRFLPPFPPYTFLNGSLFFSPFLICIFLPCLSLLFYIQSSSFPFLFFISLSFSSLVISASCPFLAIHTAFLNLWPLRSIHQPFLCFPCHLTFLSCPFHLRSASCHLPFLSFFCHLTFLTSLCHLIFVSFPFTICFSLFAFLCHISFRPCYLPFLPFPCLPPFLSVPFHLTSFASPSHLVFVSLPFTYLSFTSL